MSDNLVLIGGDPSSGKSLSLHFLENPEGVLYLNCEHKKLPFNSKFDERNITDPKHIFDAFTWAEKQDHIHTIVIDSISYLLDMFETKYIVTAKDTRAAWGDYAQYVKKLFHTYCANSTKNIFVLGHLTAEYDESILENRYSIACKGSTKNLGIESYFTTIVHTVRVTLDKLENYKNDLLVITEEDEINEYKYCYQTRVTKQSIGRRIRGPLGMWEIKETFIDNDAQKLLNRMTEYYK